MIDQSIHLRPPPTRPSVADTTTGAILYYRHVNRLDKFVLGQVCVCHDKIN